MKISFFASNPLSSTRLTLDEEVRMIEAKIRTAKHRDIVSFNTHWAVKPGDLQQVLLEDEPMVVHFSGHGKGAEGIVFHSAYAGMETSLGEETLADLFRVLKDNIRVVVLNACYSEIQAQAIVQEIDVVVGMSKRISDDAARVFAAAFYRGLAFGKSVQTAFDLGLNALRLRNLGQTAVPQLLVRPGVTASEVILVAPMGQVSGQTLPAWTPSTRWLQFGAVILILAITSYGLFQWSGFREVLGVVGDDKYTGTVFGAVVFAFFGLVPWLHAVRYGISLSLRSPTPRPHPLQVSLPRDWNGFQKPLNAALVVLLVLAPAIANVAAVRKFMAGTACEMNSTRVEKMRPRRSFTGWHGHLLGFPDSRLSEVCRKPLLSNRQYTYGESAQSYWRYVEPWFFTMMLFHNVLLSVWILYSLILLRRKRPPTSVSLPEPGPGTRPSRSSIAQRPPK